jgi:hypothetical protein
VDKPQQQPLWDGNNSMNCLLIYRHSWYGDEEDLVEERAEEQNTVELLGREKLKLECVFVCLYKLHMYGGVKFKLID